MSRGSPSKSGVILALAAYFVAFGAVRVLISSSLELDEAEQALLSQWWRLGYSAQPPLYTWLQALANHLLGVNVTSLTLLRELLLFLTFLLVYLSATRVLRDRTLAVAATLALMLIPQIVWESQREHTHSLLVLCLAAATLYLVLRLLERRSLTGYLALGLALALGTLAKYNYLLFAIALAMALATLPAGRRLLWDRRIVAALALAALVVTPHALWLMGQSSIGASLIDKMHTGATDQGPLHAIGATLLAVGSFLTPLWLITLLLFRGALSALLQPAPTLQARLLGRYLLLVLALLLAITSVLQAEQVKERWLQPLLFLTPIWILARLEAAHPARQRALWLSAIAATVGVLVLAVAALRIPLAPATGVYTRLHLPIADVAKAMQRRGLAADVVLADDYYLAGALRLHLPDATLYGPRDSYRLPPLQGWLPGGSAVLVWDATRTRDPPLGLRDLAVQAGYTEARCEPVYLEARYRYATDRWLRLGVLPVQKGHLSDNARPSRIQIGP